jgi:Inner membrane component of T3SS, periplasmic domain
MLALRSALSRGLGGGSDADGTPTPVKPAPQRKRSMTADSVAAASSAVGSGGRTIYGHLTVTQGRHIGATLKVTKPQMTIGSALTSNVVLTDADVLPCHARVSFVSSAGDDEANPAGLATRMAARPKKPSATATIEAVDGNVLAGIQLIEAGQAIEVVLPCTLKFGGCALELARPKVERANLMGNAGTPAGKRRWWVLPGMATLAGATGLSLLGLYKTVTGEWAPSKTTTPRFDSGPRVDSAKSEPTKPITGPRPLAPRNDEPTLPTPTVTAADKPAPELGAAPALPAPRPATAPSTSTTTVAASVPAPPKQFDTSTPPPTDDRQLADLRQRLSTVGLDKMLTVEKRGNMLVVDGIVGSAIYARWREVKDALVASGPKTTVITDLVKTSTSANVPNNSIASVVLGKTPYVMSTSGRRARVGEVLDDGWTVETITADTVTMRRGQTVNRINPADGFSK